MSAATEALKKLRNDEVLDMMHQMEERRLDLCEKLELEAAQVPWPELYEEVVEEARERKLCL